MCKRMEDNSKIWRKSNWPLTKKKKFLHDRNSTLGITPIRMREEKSTYIRVDRLSDFVDITLSSIISELYLSWMSHIDTKLGSYLLIVM